MTANALPEDREACFAAGMNDYIAKPIRAEELAAALRRTKPPTPRRPPAAGIEPGGSGAAEPARPRRREFVAEVVDVFLADAPR